MNSIKNNSGANISLTRIAGIKAELNTQILLINYGFTVCVPVGDSSPFDIVAIKDNIVLKIQVKFCSIDENGFAKVKLSNNHYVSSEGRWKGHYYNPNDVDAFAIVTDHGMSFVKNENQHSINIYYGSKKPRQSNTHLYSDCTFDKLLDIL